MSGPGHRINGDKLRLWAPTAIGLIMVTNKRGLFVANQTQVRPSIFNHVARPVPLVAFEIGHISEAAIQDGTRWPQVVA
ncbi:hypothetical protein EYR41_009398 [Orbilia oligospora]|uniref:Uncharacterized protein n=1 Tax=Orbilia oligospora TaxID=2813651 RepID=A0A8H2HL18_ORBOL|nr:hypothetical protein EYR41_009398 [Orbilia oligospora]